MKLAEKIVFYRKRAGMNQEMLADKLGVSRQAVSKWETGEAVPELSKVVLLAKVFEITTDELLLEDGDGEETAAPEEKPAGNWVESMPGVIGRLIRRYGWLLGVRMAISGLLFTLIGGAARAISNSMMSGFNNSMFDAIGGFAGQTVYIDGQIVNGGMFSTPVMSNPVTMLGGLIMGIGIVMMIGGTVLAIVLKKNSK